MTGEASGTRRGSVPPEARTTPHQAVEHPATSTQPGKTHTPTPLPHRPTPTSQPAPPVSTPHPWAQPGRERAGGPASGHPNHAPSSARAPPRTRCSPRRHTPRACSPTGPSPQHGPPDRSAPRARVRRGTGSSAPKPALKAQAAAPQATRDPAAPRRTHASRPAVAQPRPADRPGRTGSAATPSSPSVGGAAPGGRGPTASDTGKRVVRPFRAFGAAREGGRAARVWAAPWFRGPPRSRPRCQRAGEAGVVGSSGVWARRLWVRL